jgi:hypothetical protein
MLRMKFVERYDIISLYCSSLKISTSITNISTILIYSSNPLIISLSTPSTSILHTSIFLIQQLFKDFILPIEWEEYYIY